MRRLLTLATTFSLILFLAACESSEERAEEYYQNALTLIEDGDFDRAIVELRNVFQLNGSHLEARHALAELLLTHSDNRQGAYSQYLRLVEQYPDDLKARIALAQLAFGSANWEELDRHGEKAVELAPDDPQVEIITLVRDYRTAALGDNAPERRVAAQKASNRIDANPDSLLLREIIIDNHLREGEFRNALEQLDIATNQDPDQERFWRQRLQVLVQLGDEEAIEAQLLDMVERFPEDTEQKSTLVRYYLSRNELDKTEDFLRSLVASAEADNIVPRVDLIRFLTELRGTEAAREEINTALEETENKVPFIVLGSALDYEQGDTDAAIEALEGILETAEPSEQTNNVKVTLAQILLDTGNEVGARALVEEVLQEDAAHVEASKMRARWLIDADDPDTAIALLRTALDREPEDTGALTLMAEAYNRTGSTDLARDFLSLAVDASGNAPEETVRYARLLISEERYLPAEDILLPALRLAPNDLRLLQVAGDLYLAMEDLGRAKQVSDTLRRIDTPEAEQMAISIEAERLNQQSGTDDAMSYLEGVANSADASLASRILLIRARLATGDTEGAVELSEALLADNPDNAGAKLVVAATASGVGNIERAETLYREIVEEFPQEAVSWIELSRLQIRKGDPGAARATISEALDKSPEDPRLLWAQASYLENDGDIDGAIEIYEALYERDTNSLVVANNLASLLATYRTDEESLERAWSIARRFRDAEIPAVQDTYGWIAHRRGETGEALDYLAAAAAGLPEDAIVQFHYAEALFALGRTEEAQNQYRRVLELAGATDTRDQIGAARERLAELEAAPASE